VYRLERLMQGGSADVVEQLAKVCPCRYRAYVPVGGIDRRCAVVSERDARALQLRVARLKYATYQRFVSIMNACEGMTIGRSWIVLVYTCTDWPVRHYWLSV
jgi:hypothetical protein